LSQDTFDNLPALSLAHIYRIAERVQDVLGKTPASDEDISIALTLLTVMHFGRAGESKQDMLAQLSTFWDDVEPDRFASSPPQATQACQGCLLDQQLGGFGLCAKHRAL